MENWDEEKLRTVVLSKSGNPRTTTDVSACSTFGCRQKFDLVQLSQIVCKFFIQAIESEKCVNLVHCCFSADFEVHVWLVLGMSKRWREMQVQTCLATWLRSQIPEEGSRRSCEGEYHQFGGVLRSRGWRMSFCAYTPSFTNILHAQRHKLGSNLTPVTPETFAKWKKTVRHLGFPLLEQSPNMTDGLLQLHS